MEVKGDQPMKKLLSLMLGLSLAFASMAFAADKKPATDTTKTASGEKKSKKKSKKTAEGETKPAEAKK
jgi:hypothetical protein